MAKKQSKKKSAKKEEFNITKVTRTLLLVLVMFMGIVSIEIVTIVVMSKGEYDTLLSLDKVPISHITYSDAGRTFRDISLSTEETYINNYCENGCDLRIEGKNYKYLIERKLNGEYLVSIVSDNDYLVYKENIGESLKQTYFTLYKDYVTLVTVLYKDGMQYDYVIIVDKDDEIDRFSSLYANEIEFTDNGIIYYYDNCVDEENIFANGELIKAIRMPFSVNPTIMDRSYTNFDWCVKED